MSIQRSAHASVRTPFASKSHLLRYALGALLLVGPLCGPDAFAKAVDMGVAAETGDGNTMAQAATLTPRQPDSGSATVAPGVDAPLAAIKKIDDQGVGGQKVDWTVTGPGPATLTPASSKTTARTATSDAGIANTVFRANTPGNYVVTATTQKNPACSRPSCATWVSIRYALTVTAAAPDASSASSGINKTEAIGAAVAIGTAIALAADNGHNNNNGPAIMRTLAIAGGDGQTGAANTPLAQPLLVHAENNGASAPSVGVRWSASGGAVLSSPLSFTDGNGVAGIRVVSVGPGPGPVTVTATRSDDSSATVSFTVNVLVPSLKIVSGDGQSGFPNSRVANPLVVEADLGSSPQAGVPIAWTVTGGSATIVSNTGATNGSGQSSAIVKFGPVPGPVQITATRADGTGISQTFQLTSTQTFAFVIVSGDQQSGFTNTRVSNPLIVEAQLNGMPEAGVPTTWAVTGGDASIVVSSSQTNGSGQSSAIVRFGPTPGPVDITATRTDQNLSQVFHLTSTQTKTLAIVSGDQQTGPPNAALPALLVVQAQTNNANAGGVTINWTASGGATLSAPTSVTGGGGLAQIKVTNMGSGIGPVIVTATRADDPTATVMFTENILPPSLSIVSGDAQSGLIGSAATAPLVVKLVDGAGAPVSGQPIAWTVTSGSASVASISNTNAAGQANITFTYGSSPGPIVISASAFSGTQTVNFNETATTASSLLKITGDAQSGAPGATLPVALKVRIQAPPGTPTLAGVPINFSVISGTASVTVFSAMTDALGEASTTVNLGLTPGTVKVLAQVSGGGASATFTETVTGTLVPGALTVVSGNNQAITLNTASAPMVVLLKGNGTPLAGQTINWSTTSGTLSVGSSVTDATGHASAIITPTAGGTITVTANFPGFAQFVATQVSFSENTTLGTIPTLTTNAQSVGAALDTACTSLQSITNRTPQQQDLLNQCLALNSSSSVSTAAVATALQQLTPDVTETQTQTATTATTAQFNNLSGRMNALRGGAQGVSLAGLAFTNDSGSLPLSDVGSALLGVNDKPKQEAGNTFSRWGAFASGQIGRQDASSQGTSPAYKLDIHGLTFGVDYRENDRLVLGGAVGYTRQTTTLSGGDGDLSMKGWSLSGYASWYQKNNWYLDSSITWGNNNFDSRRHISFALPLPDGSTATVDQLAQASSGGNDLAGSLTFGRDFNKKAWAYGFYGKAQYSRQIFDAFQEQLNASLPGSGLGLRVDARTVTQVDSVFGGKIDYTHSTNWGVVIPHAEIEWQHEFRSSPNAFRAFFVDDPSGTPILIQGDPIDADFFKLGLGMSFVFPKGRSGFILYDRTIGRSGITEYNLSIGFRMEF